MRIGFIIGRIGGVDGVALETEKWALVLRRMGHEVYTLAGAYEGAPMDAGHEDLLPALAFSSDYCLREQEVAYFGGDGGEDELLASIHARGGSIGEGVLEWIAARRLDVIIPENACALPCHIAMGLGIKLAAERSGVRTITHDHDFAWERGDRYVSRFERVNCLVAELFPLRLPNSTHAVINSAAAETLATRFSRVSVVVPNVMDFDLPYGLPSAFNGSLRRDLGMGDEDLLLFQVTRIVRRKGIEVAIDLVDRLDDPRVKLVIAGSHEDDTGGGYFEELNEQVLRLKLEGRVVFAERFIGNDSRTRPDGVKTYSLSDAYAHARACTYFSTYEGFGNAFVECVLSRTPIFVNNYEPVYWPDIGSLGFRTVMLQGNVLTDEALAQVSSIIHNDALTREIAEHNFQLGKAHFSYDVLEDRLSELLQ